MTQYASQKARDTLAEYLYDKLFHKIMQNINNAIAPQSPPVHSISIIDIAGFGEFFKSLGLNLFVIKINQYYTFK